MRLWSLNPKYLDSKGLVALWREGLLAQKVTEGKTRGYRNHPQLIRFRGQQDPLAAIATYLHGVVEEAIQREYKFDESKIVGERTNLQISVTSGQLEFEFDHLLRKLWLRDRTRYQLLKSLSPPEPHPCFVVEQGEIEDWEVV